MSHRWLAICAGAAGALGALLIANGSAQAGGFAIREQSAYGQGSSYAGVAAGGDLSTMFWNPAVMTQFAGMQSASSYSWIIPYASNSVDMANSTYGAFLPGTSNTIDQALVPASYMSYQLNPNLWVGVSINAPFGLSVSFPELWAGRDYAARDSSLKTYNATPSIAYKINDMISVGFGVQIEYAKAELNKGLTPIGIPLDVSLSGSGWGYGFTAGVTLTPTPTTTIGLGYRSAIDQKINGTLVQSGLIVLPGTTNGSVSTTINLPDLVSLGIRQRLDARWTVLGTVEWTNWSRIGTSTVMTSSGAPATIFNTAVTIPFQYKDGWFFGLGAEYKWSDRLTLRGGAAYEKSPITDDVRVPLLPDNDRTWLSVGATYEIWKGFSVDLAYSHAFVKSTPIDVVSGNPSWNGIVDYVGTVSSQFDIISLGIKYRWDEPKAAPKTALYTK
jgi:long-chain fatty acid transport protein